MSSPFTPGQQLASSLTAYPPPTSPSYQGSGKDKERPHLGPKANRDQPAEGRATAPSVLGDGVLNTVHSETRLLSTLHAWALLQPALPGQAHVTSQPG